MFTIQMALALADRGISALEEIAQQAKQQASATASLVKAVNANTAAVVAAAKYSAAVATGAAGRDIQMAHEELVAISEKVCHE